MDMLYTYMIKGILDSQIVEDGGPICYAEIPKLYHIVSAIAIFVLQLILLYFWNHSLTDSRQAQHGQKSSTVFERIVAVNGIASLALTMYYKMITGKGIFVFNPCHVALLMLVVLLVIPANNFSRKLHTAWTAWLFGAIMAEFIPHLYGITQFQVYLYYYQHILIFPIGPIVLYPRYGYITPGFKNQMASFATMAGYQVAVLTPLSLQTQVNLNFALCHSPADPFYKYAGYHYFSGGYIALNIFSYFSRCITYIIVLPLKIYYNRKFKNQVTSSPTYKQNKGNLPKRQ